ncbi:unnamed protein product [Trichogramma brassicae]|uniref:L-xylulose reductase n=2 Tax=Apocrita TaxID=7400 RepID=A0A6H5I147_9HYME|nr:unnamed protein product [Trichogramma brassicae]
MCYEAIRGRAEQARVRASRLVDEAHQVSLSFSLSPGASSRGHVRVQRTSRHRWCGQASEKPTHDRAERAVPSSTRREDNCKRRFVTSARLKRFDSAIMNISFEGKRILVTGAGQGIGRETALRLSKFKGTVIALSKTQKNLDSLVKEDPRIQTVCVDLGDWAATRRAVKSVLPIDLLVNNAGVARLDPFLTAKPEDFDDTFNVNLKSIMNVSQVVAADMVARKVPGSIVNLSSQASLVAITDHATYCASKAALDMLTK